MPSLSVLRLGAVDKVCEQGYSNIFFIGCGGTWATRSR